MSKANQMYQEHLFERHVKTYKNDVRPFSFQLLKWIGNKQRFAHEIATFFPPNYKTYYEPFLGSGAVLGTLAPERAIGSDVYKPLIGIWKTLKENPRQLLKWYTERWNQIQKNKKAGYETVKENFNKNPNPADLVFLSRACYGGVVRFRKDGYMSTPIGIHNPVPPESMERRIEIWQERVHGAEFICCDFEAVFDEAKQGDLIYCDPPYQDCQSILYGAQEFSLKRLFSTIERAKTKGVFVALSLDGTKKSGSKSCDLEIPPNLFERSELVNCGRSMLRRFQMAGETLESEVVADRLLLTWA